MEQSREKVDSVVSEDDGIIYGDFVIPDGSGTWSAPQHRFGDIPSRGRATASTTTCRCGGSH